MAITPVKTGNVPTPPPVIKTDAKLTTQFNAAVKAGETGPSTSTPPPFYTPREGTFKETRNFFGKAHNTRLNWKVNPYQVKDSDKVLISGSVTVDRGGKLTNYVIDGYNSYIAKNGDVYYKAAAIDNNTYKAKYNVFTTIGNNVKNALQAVLKNKNYFQLNNKTTPVSMASAALTEALMPVGEVNLTYGIGLNGIGSKIKTEINAQLSKTDKDPNKIRVRQAIALAVSEAGVKLTGGIIQTPLTTNATGRF
jgi:hypothetical protein